MTESEAKTKWCPMVRATYFDQAVGTWTGAANAQSTGKTGDVQYGGKCIGSACMMWRWNNEWIEAVRTRPDWFKRGEKTDGFCGIAGEPKP